MILAEVFASPGGRTGATCSLEPIVIERSRSEAARKTFMQKILDSNLL
jgi:hypothetical protein